MIAKPRSRRLATHCRRGHEYTAENTFIRPTGSRRCRICFRAQQKAAYDAGRVNYIGRDGLTDNQRRKLDPARDALARARDVVRQKRRYHESEAYRQKQLARSRIRTGKIRQLVIARDGMLCRICLTECQTENLHIDHIIPKSIGGSDDLSNLQVAHAWCNQRKGNRVAA